MMTTIGIIVVFALIVLGIKTVITPKSTPTVESEPAVFKSQEENLNIIRQWTTYFGVLSIISLVFTVVYVFYLFNK